MELIVWAGKIMSGILALAIFMLINVWAESNPDMLQKAMQPSLLVGLFLMIPATLFVRALRPASPFLSVWRTAYQRELARINPHWIDSTKRK